MNKYNVNEKVGYRLDNNSILRFKIRHIKRIERMDFNEYLYDVVVDGDHEGFMSGESYKGIKESDLIILMNRNGANSCQI